MAEFEEASWLQVERRRGERLRDALERTLRDEIAAGSLRPGIRLPPSRSLALQLGISRGVVSDAYNQLEEQGFLIIEPRSAPVVADVAMLRLPDSAVRREETLARAPRFDLTPTTPDVTLFPVSRWLMAFDRSVRRAPSAVFDYRDHRGEEELRTALADHLGRTRGAVADPQRLVVCQGTAQSLDLIVRVLAAQGARRIAVEDPSHKTAHLRIRTLGLEVVPQPVDEQGVVVEGLAADAVLVTPAHQFPTGVVLSGERRRALLQWAADNDALVLEDDYDAEFRFDRQPARSLQGLAPDRVVQMGTVSKTLAPALRLGWIVAPERFDQAVIQTKRMLDDFTPSLDQLALADFLRSGEYDRHVRRCRSIYRKRRDEMLRRLTGLLPELTVEGVAAGMHLLLQLPSSCDDQAVADLAEESGVRVPALSSFKVRPSDRKGLVVGYGRLHETAIEGAVSALSSVVRHHVLAIRR